MKKLLASATAVTLLTVGYSSAAFAAKSPNDTKNCGHFKNQQEAQAFWDQNGYGVGNDPNRLDNDKDGIPCEDYKYPTNTNTTTDNKETTKPQEQTKQENTQQNSQATNNKQEQTKQTAVKAETKKQGEKLPNTASNGVTMMLASAALVLIGSILVFRRKKTNA
ncbi:cell wall anchor protein [Bacillus sp. SH7-1]|uniref:excalibur calcium-binding domain-containing protein n=1 Tax=Bacillus sp. SH7-1 TaxID=2217818 RepID=UPI0011CBE8A7|nr:excalibur calcium-binding domain-containing protein [Bacillus sp. SH7-1]TXR92008.1 cell wall anchor protein [Bacillus sp. SH7-1]